jgi:tRNA U54 and U55 pseudouridine synthase Pus10
LTSIQEELENIVKPLVGNNDGFKMHGGGREDVDVRCLAIPGRPFVLSVMNPQKEPDIQTLMKSFDN